MNCKISRTAQHLNNLRVVPRLLLAVSYVFYGYVCLNILSWFSAYPWATLSDGAVIAVAGMPAVVLSALGGVLGSVTKNYFATGGVKDVDLT